VYIGASRPRVDVGERQSSRTKLRCSVSVSQHGPQDAGRRRRREAEAVARSARPDHRVL